MTIPNGNILVINSGSSSIKYRLIALPQEQVLADGLLERIGDQKSRIIHRADDSGRLYEIKQSVAAADHHQAFKAVFEILGENCPVDAIGHRVVHGGDRFSGPALVDDDTIASMRALCRIAPLHNPVNLLGIESCLAHFPGVPQVAVFDTAFHQTMPPHAYRYAIPETWYSDYGIRRFGFHGTSHHYVARRAAEFIGKPFDRSHLITLHLGNGASATAIANGRSIDTSMGFTPLEGLVMGTRSGDLDPAIPLFVEQTENTDTNVIDRALNRESGLKGLCGTSDLRTVLEQTNAGDERARLALDLYCYRIKKYIGAYYAVLGEVDALVFTGGVGENAAEVRRLACEGLSRLGITIDEAANSDVTGAIAEIGHPESRTRILVIKTDEELQIARETMVVLDKDHA
ncbi:acetate/propionate family kinase [Methylotuvimicrobium buryatense]|uniref:Acetate kinase n=1 Tax=Methylotuvimicrobium buryatense TaxID=95641 RepID=A0A4P9ULQ8_METBY|nr:acetate kinase [Methylotuvimicrobium buryatense]QCW82174.1 acetate kinase [Methylotuvimicrobium buryatense]